MSNFERLHFTAVICGLLACAAWAATESREIGAMRIEPLRPDRLASRAGQCFNCTSVANDACAKVDCTPVFDRNDNLLFSWNRVSTGAQGQVCKQVQSGGYENCTVESTTQICATTTRFTDQACKNGYYSYITLVANCCTADTPCGGD